MLRLLMILLQLLRIFCRLPFKDVSTRNYQFSSKKTGSYRTFYFMRNQYLRVFFHR